MAPEGSSLFDAVRKACSPAIWSRGVELSRAGAVSGEEHSDDEAVFLVAQRGGMISRRVTLYPEDAEWDCACASHLDACEHVAAAVIAWQRANEQGRDMPLAPSGTGRVGYRFRRTEPGLGLEREIVLPDGVHPLETTLAALAQGRVEGPRFVASQADLAAELALGTHRRGTLPPQLIPKLFRELSRCTDTTLDGRKVSLAGDPVLPRIRVLEQGDGFRLVVEDDPSVRETFPNGAALCGDVLRPIGESRLTGRELHELPRGKYYGPDDAADLVTRVLPSLQKRLPVDLCTDRLPTAERVPPRVRLELDRDGHRLSVLASLVYGDPPQARIDAGRLVHLAGMVPLRDERAEKGLVRRLQRELQLAPGVRREVEGEAAVAFVARLERWEGSLDGDAHRSFRVAPPIVPSIGVRGDRFDVVFDSIEGGPAGHSHGRADPQAVLRAWRDGDSLVPLLGGGWAPLPADWLRRHGQRVADLLAARDAGGVVPRCTLPDLARLCEELDQPPPPGLEGLRQIVRGFEGIPRAALPEDLTATLRPYQQRGVDWLVFLRTAGVGAMLADDMGLGKTLQALCALERRALVVAPTSVLHNWAEEIRRFRPSLGTCVYHGPGRRLDPEADVTLTTYALLRIDAEALSGPVWDTVVLDEAQAIKNPDSQVARAAFGLRAGFRITLTGTPVENRLDELWSQFHFVNRGLLGGRGDFNDRYATPIAAGDPDTARVLRERIRPFLLRRMKAEVATELPPRTEVVMRCELTPNEREVYDAIRVATRGDVVEKLRRGSGVMAALEALLRLRQAACHTDLVPGQSAAVSSKMGLLLELLDSAVAEGHKMLVFSQWTSLLDRAEPHLRAAGIPFDRLDGSTRDRAGVVSGFQDPSGPPVLLLSLRAGGTGLNLTAADHVYLLDPWWNPAVEDQAADRTHRIGQDKPVMVYRLVAEETVEERILELQQRKRAMADAALGQADRATGITRDDLLELLE